MPAPLVSTQALALRKDSKGESYLSIRLLSPQLGCLDGLTRKSSKPSAAHQVDLFDEGEFVMELKPNAHSGFIKEVTITRSRKEIAKNYNALAAASEIAKLIVSNPTHQENAAEVYDLLAKSLNAWERGASPKATLLKSMYLYCKDEGYPIKEEWRMRLPRKQRDTVDYILATPLDDIEIDESKLDSALDGVRKYMSRHTHLYLEQ